MATRSTSTKAGTRRCCRQTKRSHSIATPYELFGAGQFQHALIIGAGSGSDTAIGLKYGQVGHIDAVEIDPVIARLGAEFHPEQPFSDPRVAVHIDDGRSLFARAPTNTTSSFSRCRTR